MSSAVAILISDIHATLKPPRCRGNERNWLDKQAEYFAEILLISRKLRVEIFCAGDIFDRYDPTPELINYMIANMPHMYAVAGNHDLPYHNLNAIRQSAYWTLVQAGKITNLGSDKPEIIPGGIAAYGFAYGQETHPPDDRTGMLRLAVVHDYCWYSKDPKTGFPGAPPEKSIEQHAKRLGGFDVAHFGDNHTPVSRLVGDLWIFNPGNLIRRTVDECRREPEYGILYDDGTVKRVLLESAAEDKFIADDEPDADDELEEIQEFVRGLMDAPDARFDFRQAVERYILEKKPSPQAATILRGVVQSKEKK